MQTHSEIRTQPKATEKHLRRVSIQLVDKDIQTRYNLFRHALRGGSFFLLLVFKRVV